MPRLPDGSCANTEELNVATRMATVRRRIGDSCKGGMRRCRAFSHDEIPCAATNSYQYCLSDSMDVNFFYNDDDDCLETLAAHWTDPRSRTVAPSRHTWRRTAIARQARRRDSVRLRRKQGQETRVCGRPSADRRREHDR